MPKAEVPTCNSESYKWQNLCTLTWHLILGTATPIQTNVRELLDLLEILNSGAEFVLGDSLPLWRDDDHVEEAVYAGIGNIGFPITFDNTKSRDSLKIAYRPFEQTVLKHFQQLVDDGLIF